MARAEMQDDRDDTTMPHRARLAVSAVAAHTILQDHPAVFCAETYHITFARRDVPTTAYGPFLNRKEVR